MSVWDLPDDSVPQLDATTGSQNITVEPLSVLEQMRQAHELNQVQDYLLVTAEHDFSDHLATIELSDSDDTIVHSIWQADTSDAEDTPGMPGTPLSPTDLSDSDADPPTDNIQSLIERINTKLHAHHQLHPTGQEIQSPGNQKSTPKSTNTPNMPKLTKRYYMCADCNELHTDTEEDEDEDDDDEDEYQ
jgi:hypothetical protein